MALGLGYSDILDMNQSAVTVSQPLQSFRGLHGKHGVSHICSDGGLVYSVGRNGVFTQYEFSDGQLIMVNKIVVSCHWEQSAPISYLLL